MQKKNPQTLRDQRVQVLRVKVVQKRYGANEGWFWFSVQPYGAVVSGVALDLTGSEGRVPASV